MASSSKHFFTDATSLVSSALHSQTLVNPSLSYDAKHRVIYHPGNSGNVAVLSGGGSGHEPSFSGFVGQGLLTSAVAGSVFASPSAEQVGHGIKLVDAAGGKGVCVIVMNYTGDVLNFGMAVEKAKRKGANVDMVVVGDDVGVGRKQGGKVGRRGIAGTCLVLKIAGALAEKGATLDEVSKTAKLVAHNLVSVGASLSHVHVVGHPADEAVDTLKANEIELGMGIHNESGSEKLQGIELTDLVKKMLNQMLDQADGDRAFVQLSGEDETVLLINNLGGVSPLEIGGITAEVVKQLEISHRIKPSRVLANTFMTSLNGLGFSISLLKLSDTGLGQGMSMLELLDAPTEAIGWPCTVKASTWAMRNTESAKIEVQRADQMDRVSSNFKIKHARAVTAVTVAMRKVIAAEPDITNYDTVVGDGDCGIGLKRGAEGIIETLQEAESTTDAAIFLDRIVRAVESTMDGTSGALYAIFLNALLSNMQAKSPAEPEDISVGSWAIALEQSLLALRKYTPARPGDRTLIDALEPFINTLSHTGSVEKAAHAAEEGTQKTRSMKASLGRSVYIGGNNWREVPDPGAYGLSVFFLGLAQGLR